MPDTRSMIMDQLSDDITDKVGNIHEDELDLINDTFSKALSSALQTFNSNAFDDDGFIKRMRDLDIGDAADKDTIKNVLNTVRSDYVNADSLNQSELLLRRDIYNICTQMPEMHDVINVVRDSIIECNVATGEVSRSLVFDNHEEDETLESKVKELEERFELLMAIKNFVVPKGLMHGEMYIQVTPYAKLFAELEAISDSQNSSSKNFNTVKGFKESVPPEVMNSFTESVSLFNENNLSALMEAASPMTKVDSTDLSKIDKENNRINPKETVKGDLTKILENINIYNGSSVLMAENGLEGFTEMVLNEYQRTHIKTKDTLRNFNEAQMNFNRVTSGIFKDVDQDAIDFSSYQDVKGCYVKYLDGLRLIPIRIDRRVIGYYYVSTTMDLQTNAANPNGIIDLSYQNYTRDRNLVDTLTQMIIKSFDKKMFEKNIKLKNEIAEIIMAHKFSEGKLSFIYIPENEVVRIVLNEDEDGKGHSILEPTLFPARMYLMLTLYNMLYTLNNTTTRVHYLKSSGLNKNYKAQIQRTMRKFQQRRITIDDIYSYSGVLNKVGGMGEMVLPAGRNDFKALETDTIPAVDIPINMEFLEQQRRQAISGTGVPHLLVINAIDEVDFAKTLEMANTRFISTVSSYKIDFNRGITHFYRKLLRYCTDVEDEVVNSFHFKFNTIRQQELNITTDMIQNFNNLFELVRDIYYRKDEMEDQNGNATRKQLHLRRKLAEEYLPDLNFDRLDEIVKQVEIDSVDDDLQDKVKDTEVTKEDIEQVAK